MKTKYLFTIIALLSISFSQAQLLDKLKKKAEKAAERTVEKRVEKETEKKTDEALDEVFEEKSTKKSTKKDKNSQSESTNKNSSKNTIATSNDEELNYKGEIIFKDDFSTTKLGSFPGKFTSNSGGEVVEFNNSKGLKFYPNSNVLLNLKSLPENFALEFDLTLNNVPASLYNTFFNVYVQELNVLKHNDPKNKYGAVGFSLWGDAKSHQIDVFNKKAAFEIKEKVPYDINANIIDKTSKLVVLVNKNRLRLFINGEKIVDSPNLLQGVKSNYINFRLNGTKKEEGHTFVINNLKVTATEEDLRTQLIEEGKFSTNAILFNSGSDKIKDSSFTILNQIFKVMNESDNSFTIIGHTDSDGDEDSNLSLSLKRAESVKKYLVSKGISASRLTTAGKGENEPVTDNSSAEGKAKNRRVEFQLKK